MERGAVCSVGHFYMGHTNERKMMFKKYLMKIMLTHMFT